LEGEMASATTQPQVSIIVPVYNSERFLDKCLLSLLGQTLTDIEVVCVDDGSTDASERILDRFAQADSRVIVLRQGRQGVAAARNLGLSSSVSPFVMFCDSDDWYHPDMCEAMLGLAEEHGVDAVVCGFNLVFEIPDELIEGAEEYYRLKYDGLIDITPDVLANTDVSLCNKLFRREIIDDYKIGFPEGLLFEDAYFFDAYMTVSETLYYLDRPYYNYLRHHGSIMSDTYSRSGRAADHLEIAFKYFDFLTAHGLLSQNRSFFWRRFIDYYSFSIRNVKRTDQAKVRRSARAFYASHKSDLFGPSDTLASKLKKWLALVFTSYPDQFAVLRGIKLLRRVKESILR
jgi:glycosyltransferase involved in cell wall biosynthesis